MAAKRASPSRTVPPKAPTSIEGLDEITGGGLPQGRPTLVCGGAGCGKTLFGVEFLVRGATLHNEPGVFISFEEAEKDLKANVASLGFDLEGLVRRKKLLLKHLPVAPSGAGGNGEHDWDAVFVQIHEAIESIDAKRVVLDTIEPLFLGLPSPLFPRAQLIRLLSWLKRKGVTTIITAERGGGSLTRRGLEEYVADCVIFLDHRVKDQSSVRRLRIVKYRGSTHGTDEYPFIIDEDGFSVLPITSLRLDYVASTKRISTGIPGLDTMLSGKGFFRSTTVLVSGTAGTGKSSIAARFAETACKGGERVLFFTFEESPAQLMRNMLSISIKLEPWVKKGLLQFHATRPSHYGLETHLATSIKWINSFDPTVVILDPINAFVTGGNQADVKTMLVRIVDFLKKKRVTALFTSLTPSTDDVAATDVYLSSLIDTWVLLRDVETGGERNRALYVLKSRGMAHSNQIREFRLTNNGIELLDVYVGADGVLTGSARVAQETKDDVEQLSRKQEIESTQFALEREREAMEAQIVQLRSEFEANKSEVLKNLNIERTRHARSTKDKARTAKRRSGIAREEGTDTGKGSPA